MSRFSFLLARMIGLNHMRFMWVSAGAIFVLGLSGPKYGGSLAYFGLLSARIGVLVGLFLLMVVALLRKRVAGFRWQMLIADDAIWQEMNWARQAAWTLFFIGLAVMFICLGALVGSILVYFTWRIN